jgi:regulatory protein YycH of two-component signal transduction system YycFG
MLRGRPGTRREEYIEYEFEEHDRTEQTYKREQHVKIEDRECPEDDKKEEPQKSSDDHACLSYKYNKSIPKEIPVNITKLPNRQFNINLSTFRCCCTKERNNVSRALWATII